VKAVAVSLSALGDTEPLWRDWLDDARRRFRVDGADLDAELPNWRKLLERYAEERAPVYFRRDGDVSAALRRLSSAGTRIGVFTEAPEELARVALSHLGATRHVDVLETGPESNRRISVALGADTVVVSTREELLAVR
jgi:phosphoglycolate phosphatase-like HAD superfamily hydrolase